MNNEIKPYSIHSFMLPLRWDYLPETFDINKGKEQFTFEDRTNLKSFYKCLINDDSLWKRTFFKIDGKAENFNEFHYYHSFASKTMFDLQQKSERNVSDIDENKVMVYYEIETNPNTDRYIIKTQSEDYKLVLSGISLHVFNSGVAILTFNVENHEYDNLSDVLKINEYGRRIYPQFLSDKTPPTKDVRFFFLAESIEIYINGAGSFADNFSEYDLINEREVHHYEGGNFKRSWVVKMPKFIRELFNDKFCFIQAEEKPQSIRLNILTDDRMFFQSWYGNNTIASSLANWYNDNYIDNDDYQSNLIKDGRWYSFMFGDKSEPSIANNKMQWEHTKFHTYGRWVNYGTLFGFTRDSFVSISSDVPTLLKYKAPNLRVQIKTMYYHMAVLSLAQRMSVLRFSFEVSVLSDLARSDNDKQLLRDIKILYKNYIEFINKIYFREITPYLQGIEMYSKFLEVMKTEQSIKDLDEEIEDLFNYVKLEESEKLTRVAVNFLPVTLLTAVLAINQIENLNNIYFTLENINWHLTIINIFSIIAIIWSAIAIFNHIFPLKIKKLV